MPSKEELAVSEFMMTSKRSRYNELLRTARGREKFRRELGHLICSPNVLAFYEGEDKRLILDRRQASTLS